ncbi:MULTISPECIES: hypothetical protein [unclassified Streptomyces]|uniref:hypothetical protein n=1 Tax=unclassified Streptomyces TaxID=2593676 RepID=UPI001E525357|nr:hypothetical protein [Streptomyces sp. CB02980]MCB8907507.1 hypothetical protein [Streptomyces sp. CB02980]
MTFPSTPDRDPDLRSEVVTHPYERSRLTLAMCCMAITVPLMVAIMVIFPLFILLILLFVGSYWFHLRLEKARLLGRAIKVTPESFPVLHAEFAGLQRKLDYHRTVDVYVVDDVKGKVAMTNLLGTRVLLIEGSIAADLQEQGPKPLRFVLGSFIGALKARHARLAAAVIILDYMKWTRFINPWIQPYYRAAEYTCDQIGYLCSGSLDASLGVISRFTVGKEMAPEMSPSGVLAQADRVGRDLLPRFSQMSQDSPHLVNRYVNLVAFAARVRRADFERFRAGLNAHDQSLLGDLLIQSPHPRQAGVIPQPAAR